MRFSLSLATLAFLIAAVPCAAAEPQVAFALNKDGWVEFAIKQDGKAVAAASIEILNESGNNFGTGETDDAGQTAFPLPPGSSSCMVEIKTGNRTADPIRLFKTANGIEPARVLLSYGLRPCCRFKTPREENAVIGAPAEPSPTLPEAPFDWLGVGAALGVLVIATILCFMMWR